MDNSRHDDPRTRDQQVGDRSGRGPRDREHKDGARDGEALDRAVREQERQDEDARKHPGQPSPPPG